MVRVTEKKLGRQRAVGQAFPDEGEIEIDPRQKPKEWLSTLVHEAVHLAFPNADEKEVLRAERLIAQTLWKSGIRRVHLK